MEEIRKNARVGGQKAGYLFEFKPDGVYLTVYPSADSAILFELSDMRQILKEYGVLDYDMEVLAHVVRAADGEPHLLATNFEAPVKPVSEEDGTGGEAEAVEQDGRDVMPFQLDFAKDRMTVTMKIDRSADKRPPTKAEILKALSERRVVFGIDEEAIEKGIEHGSQMIIARGQPPEKGQDAKIIRHFNLAEKGKPVTNDYDQVDYKNLNLFVLARKGDILAERVPHTLGVAGTNVFGDTIKAKPGKPKPVPAGKNTEIQEENLVVALIDGQIVDKGTKIEVDPRLVIRGDVGVSTGNIDFVGAVEIGGTVQQGFSVKATGDVTIKGAVSGGTVEGYNVYINGGIQGMNRGKVSAQEEVRASFVENGKVEAGGSIFITDFVLHSDVRAGVLIAVEGKNGLVTGGYLAAGEEIRAKTVGNPVLVSSRLIVGVNPALRQKYQEVCKDYAEAKKKLKQLTQALNTLGKIDISMLPPQRAEQISKLTRSQFPLAGRVERDEKMIKELEEQISQMRKGKIRISDKIYPGQKLVVNSIMKNLQTEEQHCTFYVEEDEVKIGPY